MNWSIRNLVVRTLGHLVVSVAWTGLAGYLLTVEEIPGPDWAPPHLWPTVFDFPLTYYVLIGAIGLASFGLTVPRWRASAAATGGRLFPGLQVTGSRTGSSACSGSRAPPRLRRGRRCGSS